MCVRERQRAREKQEARLIEGVRRKTKREEEEEEGGGVGVVC